LAVRAAQLSLEEADAYRMPWRVRPPESCDPATCVSRCAWVGWRAGCLPPGSS